MTFLLPPFEKPYYAALHRAASRTGIEILVTPLVSSAGNSSSSSGLGIETWIYTTEPLISWSPISRRIGLWELHVATCLRDGIPGTHAFDTNRPS